MRVKFFDEEVFYYSKEDKINQAKKLLDLDGIDFKAKSYSLYMKDKKVYPSLYEAQEKENLDDIFIDLDHLMIYHEANE